MTRKVVIASAVRTPVGSNGGALKSLTAVDLGVIAAKEAIKRAGIKPEDVDETVLGCVLQAGQGQNVARQVSIHSGIPKEKPAMTLNILCGSGLRSVSLATQMIMAGDDDIVLAGGTESMSNAPYLVQDARWGAKMGDKKFVDDLMRDGLTDAFEGYPMGMTAENIVEKYGLTREEQDQLAAESQNRAEKARKEGRFKDEIVPVEIKDRKGNVTVVEDDEYIKEGVTVEGISKLKPAFKKGGSVTAANASGINDGASALIIMSEEKAKELGIKPLATIVSYATEGVDPAIMGTGPIPTVRKALEKANLSLDDMELIEANEAFAAQALSVIKELGLNTDIVNVNGGAIALGHPIGASGAIIFTKFLYVME